MVKYSGFPIIGVILRNPRKSQKIRENTRKVLKFIENPKKS